MRPGLRVRSLGSVPRRLSDRLDILALAPIPGRSNGIAALQVGGSLQCAWLLAGLARLGHTVRVISVGPLQPSDVEPGDLGPDVAVDWFAVEKLDTAEPPAAEDVRRRRAQFEVALDRALADRRPDVVILGNESHPWYAADPCAERGLQTVLIAQGVPTAGLPSGIYDPPARREFVEQLAKVDLIVAVSDDLEAILRGLGLDRVRTIETGIDTDAFRPRPKDADLLEANHVDPGRFVVGSFVHMRPEKRVLDIVSSAEIVLRSEPGAVYLIAGGGPLTDETVEQVAAKGLGDSFRFVGEVDHPHVPAYMSLCDAVVLASEREGYSLVAREAQASGCALIASDIPAGLAAARGGQAALTFSLGDVEDLAAKTLILARDEALRRSLAERGRAAVVENGGDDWIRVWSETIVATARRRERAMEAIARGGMNELALTERDGRLAVRKRYATSDTRRRKRFGSGARNEALLHAHFGDLIPAELSAETSPSGDYEEVCLAWRDGTSLEPGEVDHARAHSAGAVLARIHAVTGEWYGSIDGR
ncbi:MAG: hypothetical protein QOD76_553, partial [Solirubrobacteraceae bacterium]|nr:hypothetical protein [Solirubrobacteraceae bacterium]